MHNKEAEVRIGVTAKYAWTNTCTLEEMWLHYKQIPSQTKTRKNAHVFKYSAHLLDTDCRGTEEEGNDKFCQSVTLISYASQLQYVGDMSSCGYQ